MGHKFRIVFRKKRYCPLPTGYEYFGIKFVTPLWISSRLRIIFIRGFVGGYIKIGGSIELTFPLPFKSINGKGKMIEKLIKEKNGKAA